MARPIKLIEAEPDIVKEQRRRSRATISAVRERERADNVLGRLEGLALGLATTPKRVSTWSKRFEEQGLAGLDDKIGRGRKHSIPSGKVARVMTDATRPAQDADPLELAHDSEARRCFGKLGTAHMVAERLEAVCREGSSSRTIRNSRKRSRA